MNTKKILKKNTRIFINDIKRVKQVVVLPPKSSVILHVTKTEVLKEAETYRIKYRIDRDLFYIPRDVMVIE